MNHSKQIWIEPIKKNALCAHKNLPVSHFRLCSISWAANISFHVKEIAIYALPFSFYQKNNYFIHTKIIPKYSSTICLPHNSSLQMVPRGYAKMATKRAPHPQLNNAGDSGNTNPGREKAISLNILSFLVFQTDQIIPTRIEAAILKHLSVPKCELKCSRLPIGQRWIVVSMLSH